MSNNAFGLQTQLDSGSVSSDLIERADKLLGQGSDAADKACKRRRPEWYSQPLVKQRLIVRLLAAYKSDLQHSRPTRLRAFAARLERAQITYPFPPDIETTIIKLQEAKETLYKLQNQHEELRRSEQQAEKNIQTNSTVRESKLMKSISKSEDSRRTYKILEYMRKKPTR